MTPYLWQILLVFVLVLLNAFFVAFEFGIVSIRRTRVRELVDAGSRRAGEVDLALSDIYRYVSAAQVGITMSSLAIGWLGEPAIEHVIRAMFGDVLPQAAVVGVAFTAVAFLMITYLHVVIGEVVPKNYALQRSEAVALRTIWVMRLFTRVMWPLVSLLNHNANAINRRIGLGPSAGMHMIHSEEELKMLVSQSSKGGVLQDSEQEMLYNVFDFADTDVAEVMVPRPDVVAFAVDQPPAELMRAVVAQPYTRYPVYRDTMDDIVGILHIRDLFNAAEVHGKDKVHIESLLRPAHVVPEAKSLAGLLADFRRSKSHMALVVDEYGSLSGIVTLEDLIEEIVGEIVDEHDLPEEPVERISENHIRVDGKFPLDELNDRFHIELPTDDYHTVGGFVFGLLGQQPHEGDVVRHGNLRLEVTETDGPRIVHVDIIELSSRRAGPEAAPDAGPGANGAGPAEAHGHDVRDMDSSDHV